MTGLDKIMYHIYNASLMVCMVMVLFFIYIAKTIWFCASGKYQVMILNLLIVGVTSICIGFNTQ